MRNLSRKASIGQTGAPASGRPLLPAPVRRPIHDRRVGGDDAHRHVVAHPFTGDDARRLMVAQDHEHQILVVELLHERGHRVE